MRLALGCAGFVGVDVLGRVRAGHTGRPYDHGATRRTRQRRRGGRPATSAFALWRWGDALARGGGVAGLGGVAEWKDRGATDIDGSWVSGTENAPRLMYGARAIRPREVVSDRGCRGLVVPALAGAVGPRLVPRRARRRSSRSAA